jgi:hypothetical protein
MTSNLNLKLKTAFRKPPAPPPSPVSPNPIQGATVPISLYREISADLHSTRSDLESLKTQNHELVRNNQQLRLEIERVVQTALHLRQVADSSSATGAIAIELFAPQAERAEQGDAASLLLENSPTGRVTPLAPENKLIIEQDSKPRSQVKSEAATEISTWWLIAVICLIVLSAFGTGFLLVRPLLPSR